MIPLFQSTPSVGRETRMARKHCRGSQYFNPLPPWGGRQHHFLQSSDESCPNFNPLPPWGGRHDFRRIMGLGAGEFQSTPSVGRETLLRGLPPSCPIISIHSLRGEGDLVAVHQAELYGISIHSLRGEGDIRRTSS